MSLRKVRVADNIDLMAIMQEFESFYQIKFGKMPKFVSKVDAASGERGGGGGGGRKGNGSTTTRNTTTEKSLGDSVTAHRYDRDYGICLSLSVWQIL